MTDWRQDTVKTYNNSAAELAEYFKGIGARVEDVELALDLADNKPNPNILEIGCGDGRDAEEIVKYTNKYVGFDISTGMIELARQRLPQAKFEVADVIGYDYPKKLDVVFAFASLLHLNREEVSQVLQDVRRNLNPGGIFYISLKYAAQYSTDIQKDKFGPREFYFYNPKLIQELAGPSYRTVHTHSEFHGHTKWFEIALTPS